jgi:DNA end-binding protein Ku
MPRSIWTGSISFGLVNVPVRIYSAVAEQSLHFHLIHEKDEGAIGYEKICKKEDKPVPDDEIVKGFEYAKGKFVYLTDEDFEAAKVEGFKTIDIRDFVPYEQIDPIYFRHTYYVGPQDGAEQVYALLTKAMDESGLAGITKFVMRDRQNLGCLRVRDGMLTLEQMYFADEIRPLTEVRPAKVQVERQALHMARQLIAAFEGDFDATKYKDTYREALQEVIDAKRAGKQVHAADETEEDESPVDLMEALRQSITGAKTGPARGSRKPPASKRGRNNAPNGGGLNAKTKEELLRLAKRANIAGRSQMGKAELLKALRQTA